MGHLLYARTAYLGFRLALLTRAFLAISPPVLLSERHADKSQELFGLFVGLCARNDGDIHTFCLLDIVVINFRKNKLFPDTEGIITPSVKTPGGDSLEVPYPWKCDIEKPVNEIVHPRSSQGHTTPNGVALPELKISD